MAHEILKRVMLVEDDPDIQAIVSLAFADAAIELHVCSCGEEALGAVPRLRPDLIVLDCMMPGMGGTAACLALRRLPETARTPIVFMTARAQPHEIAEYRRAGAADVIVKPFEASRLLDQLVAIWARFHEDADARQAAFEALRRRYFGELPDRLAAIRRAAEGAAAGGADLAALSSRVHRMVGSAAIFGLERLSRAARSFEESLTAALEGGLHAEARAGSRALLAQVEELERCASDALGPHDERAPE